MRQQYKKKMIFLITLILVLSFSSSKVIAEGYKQDGEVPDIYGTTSETIFTFEVNGQILQPGESIYIETAPDQQPVIRVGK
ncbi:hypothetical protein MKY92_27475 [Paenibacillus sp. FSL R5-0623]|uniref:hypothetical protein n=1 Tax=Paenibacillus sp. FSL R5-0623 TaxID=2921651 RepID=UPI0030DB1FBE